MVQIYFLTSFIPDIDATIQLLDNVISFYDVSTNVESIIEKGPGEGASELEPYLQSLNQLAAAQKYFEEHIPQSVEKDNVVSKNISGSMINGN